MRKKILVIACYWLIFILAGCLENKEENIIVGKPCIEPEKRDGIFIM